MCLGCPVLNLKLDRDVKAMRAIAEEAFEMVRSYKGSHSGEHGDGLVRSEFHRAMFGDRMVESFEWVKDRMDPVGLLNPNRSEEHTSELQSLMRISYAVFRLKKNIP